MVLQGDSNGQAPPFDASLYNASLTPSTPASEHEIEYRDCDAVLAFFTTTPDVEAILPEGIVPYSNPPTAGVLLTHYPFSTVGEYHEYLTVIQVEDLDGELAYYIPYIYVTNDAALAAGREMAGAPKKLAEMDLDTEGTIVSGHLDREGDRLAAMSVKPESRARGGLVETLLDERMPLLSIRHLPPIEGGDGCTQLVKWYADMDFLADAKGREKRWVGPADLSYEAESPHDPVHKVSVERLMTGLYGEFDMALGTTEVHKEWEL
ncbi:acetoacetate decarboxylase family protein [Halorientalis halophila]|uniref:acetoacetate decarboxylase family protein n=1 Tax=Halorientalis halophila TaxID=3108499 RepID=UPI00300AB819